MTDKKRLELVRHINELAPDCCQVVDRYDYNRNNVKPMYYQLVHDDITLGVGCVFGNYCYYDDNRYVWSGNGLLAHRHRVKADAIVASCYGMLAIK